MAGNIQWIDDFSGGVELSLPQNKIPQNFLPRGINTALLPTPKGGVALGKRPGYALKGTLDGSANAYGTSLAFFAHNNAGTVTEHLISVNSDGNLFEVGSPSTAITIPTTNTEFSGSTFSSPTIGFKLVQANNFLFGVNGVSYFKVFKDSGTLYCRAFGARAPTVAPTGTLGGASSGVMSGDYEFLCTFYNSKTGVESGIGPTYAPTTLTDQNIDIDVSGLGTPNLDYDKVNIYIRKPSIGGEFVRNASMQVANGDTSTVLNLSDDDINNMILVAPAVNDNSPIPSGTIDICWHLSRMFATDGINLYYSKVGQPENWNILNYERVNPNDGQKIIAIYPATETSLLILKERSCYLLVGDTSQNWQIRLLTNSIGCSARLSVSEGEGVILWWSHVGPVVWPKSGEPQLMDASIVRELYRRDQLDVSNYNTNCRTIYDTRNKRFLVSIVPKTSSSYDAKRLTILPYSTVNSVWESSGWDLDTINAMCTGRGNNGEYNVFFASTNKFVYELSDRFLTDGAQNQTGGSLFYECTSFGANTAVFVASTPPYSTSKSYCKIINSDTLEVHRSLYSLSGSGTLTATLTTAFGTVPTNGWIIFDIPVVEFDTKVMDGDAPRDKKRYFFVYLRSIANGDVKYFLSLTIDNTSVPGRVWEFDITKAGHEYGTGGTISGATEQFQGRIAKVGEECFMTLVGFYPLSRWLISGLGIGSQVTYER